MDFLPELKSIPIQSITIYGCGKVAMDAVDAKKLKPKNFHALMRLHQNRAEAFLTKMCEKKVSNVLIWGGNSICGDFNYANIENKRFFPEKVVDELAGEKLLYEAEFIDFVKKRGAKANKAKKGVLKISSAKAICDHLKDWYFG